MKFYFNSLLLLVLVLMVSSCSKDDESEETVRDIRINKITIIKFPATESNGAGWDATSGPDIYPKIYKGTTEMFNPSTFIQNANSANDYEWSTSTIILTEPTLEHSLYVYDYDDGILEGSDDYMGGVSFIPYDFIDGTPSIITIDAGGTVAFELEVTYAYY